MIKAGVKVSPLFLCSRCGRIMSGVLGARAAKRNIKYCDTRTTLVTKATDSELPASQRQKQTLLI